jgi:hypothetical protein
MHIQSLLLDTPAFNYQLHWGFLPWCVARTQHRNTLTAAAQTNSFAAALLRCYFFAELLLFCVRRARGKIYDFIF